MLNARGVDADSMTYLDVVIIQVMLLQELQPFHNLHWFDSEKPVKVREKLREKVTLVLGPCFLRTNKHDVYLFTQFFDRKRQDTGERRWTGMRERNLCAF